MDETQVKRLSSRRCVEAAVADCLATSFFSRKALRRLQAFLCFSQAQAFYFL